MQPFTGFCGPMRVNSLILTRHPHAHSGPRIDFDSRCKSKGPIIRSARYRSRAQVEALRAADPAEASAVRGEVVFGRLRQMRGASGGVPSAIVGAPWKRLAA